MLWNHGENDVEIQVNATVLEFEGATGWPQLEIAVYNFLNFAENSNELINCGNYENYTCRLYFESTYDSKYIIAVSNLDPEDAAVYNITFLTQEETDFQYTTMFDMELPNPAQENTIGVTYFETTNPYLYRLEGFSETRVIIEWLSWDNYDEIYFLIYNKGETCEMFVGLVGLPYYTIYPSLTSFVKDFEDYGDTSVTELDMWTFVNYTVGNTFLCESGHRYTFWINRGAYETPDVYIIFDTFGETQLNYESDFLADNPDDTIALRPSWEDPWVEFNRYQREAVLGWIGIGGAGITGTVLVIIFLRKKYY